MRTRIAAVLATAALTIFGLPAMASASCTQIDFSFIDGGGQSDCIENIVCPPVAGVVKNVDCVE